ncbi:uncharacterized protein [Montipora foliosa]|uniref:uncharacterized protein n=1 Tax=Montipora foliosa TaxID=591990 RepID=UPI0035F1483A
MCFPSTSAEDYKKTITSSSNECVIPLITINCPTTSGEGQKKALPSGNDECTIPFLSLPTISGQEYAETIASGNSKSTIPLSSTPPASAGDDEGELIGDINDESGTPLLNGSSTYPAGNEGTDIADGNNAIPLVVVSSSTSNQEDVPTKEMGDECDEDCESFAPLELIKLAWQIARGMSNSRLWEQLLLHGSYRHALLETAAGHYGLNEKTGSLHQLSFNHTKMTTF